MRVAVTRDWEPFDELYRDEGFAGLGRARGEHLGDADVIHDGERLALGVESCSDFLRVQPGLYDLQRDVAPDR